MEIYQPEADSYLLQKAVQKDAFGKVLDLGTGSGIQALTAAGNPKVTSVLAVDINPEAVRFLQEKIGKEQIGKVRVQVSDLFSQVKGRFDTIIFNPPYLPQEKIAGKLVEEPALYGGKHGWEISERFFREVSLHLSPEGKALFLFSTLTNQKKIEEIISRSLLEFQEIGREKVSFEELLVYLVKKSALLQELEKKKITNIYFLAQGRRGKVYSGKLRGRPVAIKAALPESRALHRIENEACWLKTLNKKGIGPKLIFSGVISGRAPMVMQSYLVMVFVAGKKILDWIRENPPEKIKTALREILNQCLVMDQLGVNKKEMHHPLKHIIVGKEGHPTMIDFERCKVNPDARNVTQFLEFLSRNQSLLERRGLKIISGRLRNAAVEYKDAYKDALREGRPSGSSARAGNSARILEKILKSVI